MIISSIISSLCTVLMQILVEYQSFILIIMMFIPPGHTGSLGQLLALATLAQSVELVHRLSSVILRLSIFKCDEFEPVCPQYF